MTTVSSTLSATYRPATSIQQQTGTAASHRFGHHHHAKDAKAVSTGVTFGAQLNAATGGSGSQPIATNAGASSTGVTTGSNTSSIVDLLA